MSKSTTIFRDTDPANLDPDPKFINSLLYIVGLKKNTSSIYMSTNWNENVNFYSASNSLKIENLIHYNYL